MKKIAITLDRTTNTPKSKIPKSKHHRFYWYVAMIMCGAALEAGTLEDSRDDILSHLMFLKSDYLDNNSWDKTIVQQFESAYSITRMGNNNLYEHLIRCRDLDITINI